MTSRRIAIGLAASLTALAALVAWASAALEDQPPGQSIDPQHLGVAITGAFAAYFCFVALWRLREVWRGRRRWAGATVWFGLAVIALFVVVLVAVASRLGG